jgi:hypothetical protein
MIATLSDQQGIAAHGINQAMPLVDSPGPESRQGMFQGLRLADAGEGIALNLPNQQVDPFEYNPVGLLPIQVVGHLL